MNIHQQHLLITITPTCTTASALTKLIGDIKKNQFDRVGSSTLYFLQNSSLILPKEKPQNNIIKTKWENFAQKKKIEKQKKPFFIKDEETNEVMHRYGAKSKKNLEMRSGIYANGITFSKMKREKELRVGRNREQMERNLKKNEDMKRMKMKKK